MSDDIASNNKIINEMNYLKSIALATLMLLLPATSAMAEVVFAFNGLKYTVTGENTVKVGKIGDSKKPSGKLVIPAQVTFDGTTYDVIAIDSWGFFDCTMITEVVLPPTVSNIDIWAFARCESIKQLTIPATVTRIGYAAFENCTSLTSIELPVTLKSVSERLFNDCYKLSQVILPPTVTRIESLAFSDCKSLKKITLPDSLKVIGNSTFAYCDSLTDIVFPKGLERIGDDAFKGCYGLKSIMFPESLQSLGQDAFRNCKNLETVYITGGTKMDRGNPFPSCDKLKDLKTAGSENSPVLVDGVLFSHDMTELISFRPDHPVTSYTVPASVKIIASHAFSGNKTLRAIKMTNVEHIGLAAFYGCSALAEVDFGKRLESIGKEAFNDCRSLTEIYLPDSMKEIGQIPFNFCYGLTKVSVSEAIADDKQSFNNTTFRFSGDKMIFTIRKSDGTTRTIYYNDLYDISRDYIFR